MIFRTFGVATLLLAAALPVAAAERNFPVTGFDRLQVRGSADVTVTTGKAVGVRATGDPQALDRLDIRVEKGALIVGTKRGSWGWDNGKVAVAVTVPMLRAASVSGSGDVRVDRVDTAEFEASVAGSGNLALPSLTASRARFSVMGSGNVDATGKANETRASVAGSGNLNIGALRSGVLTASVSGSGEIDAFATTSASVSAAGSGDIRVRGGARCAISKAGSGRVDCS